MLKLLAKLSLAGSILFCGSASSGLILNEINMGSSDWFEVYNYGDTALDLQGYRAEFSDSSSNYSYLFPMVTLAANSTVGVVAEDPLAGELDFGRNITFLYSRNLSISLYDSSNTLLDFWAHGSSVNGAPAGVSFDSPLALITNNTNSITYQRATVDGSGNTYFASDWTSGAASRGSENAGQVRFAATAVPEPTGLALLGIGMIAAFGARRRKA